MKLTFRGGKEFARVLKQLPGMVSAEILETSLMAGAEIIVARAREKCPKPAIRRRPESVRLADSIRATTKEKDAAHAIVNVGTNVPYAHLVEYGHQIVPRGPTRERISVTSVSRTGRVSVRSVAVANTKRQATGGFVPPRPFLRPAFDESREQLVERIGQVMGKEIEAQARRMADVARAA